MAQVSARSRRYAEAAFEVARADGTLDQWEEQLQVLGALLADPVLERALTSPVVPKAQKETMLLSAFADMDARVRNFLVLLVRQDRLGLLTDIVTTFRAMLSEHRGIEVVEVTTAQPLDPDERDLVTERLASYLSRRVELETRVDPEIIGGVIARIGDRVLDGSVRGRLDRLRVALARPA